jgi:hypothetical protein
VNKDFSRFAILVWIDMEKTIVDFIGTEKTASYERSLRTLHMTRAQGAYEVRCTVAECKQEEYPMLEAKDFATGCLTIILCVVLFPLFFLVFKLTLIFAVFLAIVIGVVLGITIIGRIVRLFITGK